MNEKHHITINIVDGLAEITRFQDRHLIERSLLSTIDQLMDGESARLYRVEKLEGGDFEVTLLSFSERGVVDSLEESASVTEVSDAIEAVLDSGDSVTLPDPSDSTVFNHLFPAFDTNGDIFAILLYTGKPMGFQDQRLAHGILKVYTNYLSLVEKSQKDKLTGLLNRESLDRDLTRLILTKESPLNHPVVKPSDDERRRALDANTNAYVAVVDIDHFKSINDRFGHLFGDEVLVLVARLLIESLLREGDGIYRYGGEEFVILIKAVSIEDAKATFDRVRQAIAAHEFPQLGNVTISVGITDVNNQQTPPDLIGEADKALYYAKANGRNQIAVYSELVEQGEIEVIEKVSHDEPELF